MTTLSKRLLGRLNHASNLLADVSMKLEETRDDLVEEQEALDKEDETYKVLEEKLDELNEFINDAGNVESALDEFIKDNTEEK